MEFRIPEKKKYKILLGEKVFEYSKPTMKMSEEFADEVDGLDDKERAKKTKLYVSKCGIPLEVLEDLDSDQFTALFEFLNNASGLKKN